jgi:hypothetical protein
MTIGHTHRYDEANSRFPPFCVSAYFNHGLLQESQKIRTHFVKDVENFNAKAVGWYNIHRVLKTQQIARWNLSIARPPLKQSNKIQKKCSHITISLVGMDPSIQFYGLSTKAQADTLIAMVTISSNIKLEKFTNYIGKWKPLYWLCPSRYSHEFCN